VFVEITTREKRVLVAFSPTLTFINDVLRRSVLELIANVKLAEASVLCKIWGVSGK